MGSQRSGEEQHNEPGSAEAAEGSGTGEEGEARVEAQGEADVSGRSGSACWAADDILQVLP